MESTLRKFRILLRRFKYNFSFMVEVADEQAGCAYGIQDIESIYFSPEEAAEEIQKRWKDEGLKRKVADFIHDDFPEEFRFSPRAVLSRHVMSPNFELLYFLQLAQQVQLQPVGLEYIQDKFVTKNDDKYFLGKLTFYEGVGKRGGRKISSIKILDFDINDGKRIIDINTNSGKNFVEFHHDLLASMTSMKDIIDMSAYYKRNGIYAEKYYQYILSLFICYGVLFEAFLTSGSYIDLTRDDMLPNYRTVVNYFGLKPLIVRLAPKDSEDDLYWRYYPERLKSVVSGIL